MMQHLSPFLSAISITCKEIGNCPSKTSNLSDGFANIVNILTILVGMLSVIFLIVSGLQMTLSMGDPKRYQQGRQGLLYAVVGIAVAVVGYSVITFIINGL